VNTIPGLGFGGGRRRSFMAFKFGRLVDNDKAVIHSTRPVAVAAVVGLELADTRAFVCAFPPAV